MAIKWTVTLRDECGESFVREYTGGTRDGVYAAAAEDYPESRVRYVESDTDLAEEEAARYHCANAEYEDDNYDPGEDYF